MKRILLFMFLMMGVISNAAEVTIEGLKYALYNDSTARVIGCADKSITQLNIPNEVNHNRICYSVTSIGDSAFYKCEGLTSITLPDNLTSIGHHAFDRCTSLTSVTIPNSVTSIGRDAFSGCTGLTSVTLPDNLTSIGAWAFAWCTSLTSVTIPNSVTSIGGGAFFGCNNLTNVTLSQSIKKLGNGTFNDCSKLATIEIPNSVRIIGDETAGEGVFEGCTGLTNIILPNSLTSIGSGAFRDCTGLTNITLPNSLTSIGSGAFRDCTGLTNITLPNSLTSIGVAAFSGCTGLTSVTIPNSVTSIGTQAFYGCTGLTSVTIPNSVTSIGVDAFYNCIKLKEINVAKDNPVYNSLDGVLFNRYLTSIIMYPPGKTDEHYTIPNTVTAIVGDHAFAGCKYLNTITIPKSLQRISGYYSFSGSNLKKVIVEDIDTWLKVDVRNFEYGPLAVAKRLFSSDGKEITHLNIKSRSTLGSTSYIQGLISLSFTFDSEDYQVEGFAYCINLTNIYCYSTIPPTNFSSYNFKGIDKWKCTLHVPVGSGDAYRGAKVWQEFNIVEDLTTGIDDINKDNLTTDQQYFTIDGKHLTGKPTNSGIYIKNGKKYIVK